MDNIIKKIIKDAIYAPSGENCQPWSYKILGSQLFLFNESTRDLSLYNYNQNGSYVSHGAAIETIIIAASNYGLEVKVELLPAQSNPELVAIFTFVQNNAILADPLIPFIRERSTNRKPYKDIALSSSQQFRLKEAVKSINLPENYHFLLLTEKNDIHALAPAMTLNEKMIFSNHLIHKFFFEHLRWTKQEDDEKKNGFYIKALELTVPQILAFKLFKYWPIIKLLNYFGFYKIAGQANLHTYQSSGALGIIVTPSNDRIDYILAGRMLQRVWLSVTSLGLSMQPVTGTLFLRQHLLGATEKNFSETEARLIKDSYDKIKSKFKITDENIAMLFRIGVSDPPSAQSSRFDLRYFLKD